MEQPPSAAGVTSSDYLGQPSASTRGSLARVGAGSRGDLVDRGGRSLFYEGATPLLYIGSLDDLKDKVARLALLVLAIESSFSMLRTCAT